MTVTTITPTGKQRTTEVKTLREAGKAIAYTLYDNLGIPFAYATRLAMQAESDKSITEYGYTFTITS